MFRKKNKIFISLALAACFLFCIGMVKANSERSGIVTLKVKIDISSNPNDVKLWMPYPVSDEYQDIEDVKIAGNYLTSGIYREKTFGNMILYTEWMNPKEEPALTLTFKAKRKEVVRKDFPIQIENDKASLSTDLEVYLKGSSFVPVSGKVKKLAEEVTKGKKTILEKARALYNNLIDNMERDPNVIGCGKGDVCALIDTKKGKCVDFHSVYVAMARSVGVPAREVLGIRLGKEKEENITKSQHCWAEFYLPGYGWVPIDPGDVSKIKLTKKITNLADLKEYREYYFGAVDPYRIKLSQGRDLMLNPEQKDGS
ncbi:MAG: transglutaminase domain-containing protein, partial [Armatimonadetes bacterium]|nr:transglutaminase domain-containing protein [Armatimonadota bacterium]